MKIMILVDDNADDADDDGDAGDGDDDDEHAVTCTGFFTELSHRGKPTKALTAMNVA